MLQVAGERVELEAGKAICFQDSFLHSLHHEDDSEERLSLARDLRKLRISSKREAKCNTMK